jgi:hypothetical protein
LQKIEVSPTQACFPAAAQAAVLRRETEGRKPETVHLLTSLEPHQLSASAWLARQRQAWGIENGLHQRLDISADEDRSRVRDRNAIWVMGMLRRFSISLMMEWKSRAPSRKHKSQRDFYEEMSRDYQRKAFNLVNAANPTI